MTQQKLPEFGDREAVARMKAESVTTEQEDARLKRGKVFTVRVKWFVVGSEEKNIEVLALDADDAEELAWQEVVDQEGAEDDTVETEVISVRESGAKEDDSGTLELFTDST